MRNVKQVRRSKRRIRKSILVVGFALIVALGLFVVKNVIGNIFNNQPLAFNEVEDYKLEDYENIVFKTTFTNDKKINKIIEEEIARVLEAHNDIFTTSAQLDISVNGNIDEARNILSLKYTNASENIKDIYGVSNIDLKTNKVLDVKPDETADLKSLSMLLRAELAKNPALEYNKTMYLETAYDKDLFKYVTLNETGLEVFFTAETFGGDDYTAVTLAYSDALAYLSDDLVNRIDKDYTKTETVNVRYIDPTKPMVALTYDDGPNPATTRGVAEYFNKNDSALTFFWLGERVENNKDFVKEMYQLGHEIGNHSYNHQNFNTLSSDKLIYQTETMNTQIKEITGQDRVLIRAPYGASNESVRAQIKSPLIMWSTDTEDWRTRNEASNLESMRKTIRDGSIILMHDLYEPSVNAGIKILDEYKDQFQFVTVTEMYQYKGIALEDGKMYNGTIGK